MFSAYLLASTVSTPIYGKLADLWGRKRILLFGLGLFAIGSVMSGRAGSMPELIVMRVIQGLGAGAVGPIVLTLLGDLFSLEERAKVQGWFSAVWGISSVAGPWLGGYLTDNLSWRWVFYVTVPFAVVAAWVLVRHVNEDVRRDKVLPIDWPGASLLTVGSTLLLLAILSGPKLPIWMAAGLMTSSAVLLAAFVAVERRAGDPILPPDLFTHVPTASAIAASFLIGALLFGIDTYVPLYVQGVLGGKATKAGEVLTPLFFSWALQASFVAARLLVRLGFRTTAVAGMGVIALGMMGLTLGAALPGSAIVLFKASLVVTGFGFGPASLSCILGVQNAVDWNRRGAATGAVTFSRVLGGALGVGILGATLAYEFARRLASAGASGVDIVAALRPETHDLLTPDQLRLIQDALGRTLRDVFLQMLALAVLAIFCATRLAPGRAVSRPEPAPESEGDLALAALES